MYAYSHRYNCDDIVLLYPDTGEVTPKSYGLLEDEKKRIRVAVINLNRDLRREREGFLRDMDRIVNT